MRAIYFFNWSPLTRDSGRLDWYPCYRSMEIKKYNWGTVFYTYLRASVLVFCDNSLCLCTMARLLCLEDRIFILFFVFVLFPSLRVCWAIYSCEFTEDKKSIPLWSEALRIRKYLKFLLQGNAISFLTYNLTRSN